MGLHAGLQGIVTDPSPTLPSMGGRKKQKKRKTMAKTIEEILEELNERQKENPKERSVLLIAGYENEDIKIKVQGKHGQILNCLASAMTDCAKITELITSALFLMGKNNTEEK